MSTDAKKILISPSIIAADLSVIGELVRGFDPGLVNLLHCDVMDGNFVPNLTFGPGFINDLKKHTDITARRPPHDRKARALCGPLP